MLRLIVAIRSLQLDHCTLYIGRISNRARIVTKHLKFARRKNKAGKEEGRNECRERRKDERDREEDSKRAGERAKTRERKREKEKMMKKKDKERGEEGCDQEEEGGTSQEEVNVRRLRQ